MDYPEIKYPLQKETYQIIGICMEVHRNLGHGFLENVYKDALEYEFQQNGVPYDRERSYRIKYRDGYLKHGYNADFVVYDENALEVKATNGVATGTFSKVINYLAASKCKIGLLVNFGEPSLYHKRFIL